MAMKTEDILKHYGVKGMKWEHRKEDYDAETQALIEARNKNLKDIENSHDEIANRIAKGQADLDALKNSPAFKTVKSIKDKVDAIGRGKDAIKDKIGAVSKDVKKKGQDILSKVMGPLTYPKRLAKVAASLNKNK